MANNKKAPKAPNAPKAPQTTAEPKNQPAQQAPVMTEAQAYVRGLSPDKQVDLLKMMHETYRIDPNASEHTGVPVETIAKINHATAIAQVVVLANEVTLGQNPFAITMRKSHIQMLTEVCNEVGVNINQKFITAVPETGGEEVVVSSQAIEVSEETQKQLKEEEAAKQEAPEVFDPTKIETDEQLMETLKQIMAKNASAFGKLTDATNFYQAYLKIQASKSENKDEELAKINKMSMVELFEAMAKFLVSMPVVLKGFSNHLYTITSSSKSPVQAFCAMRNASKNRTTGAPSYSDAEIAQFVRILISWSCDTRIAEQESKIQTATSDIELLKKDEKKNAKGIADLNEKIETYKKNIEHFGEVRQYVIEPSSSVADEWPTMFKEKDKLANLIYGAVVDCYYDDIEVKEMKRDIVVHNVQQYIGVITNMFRNPGNSIQNYSESNILPLEPITPAEPENPEESKK